MAAVAEVPARPADHLQRFVRTPDQSPLLAPTPDPTCAEAPRAGTQERVLRSATQLLCAAVSPGMGGISAAAAQLVANAPLNTVQPDAGLRVAVGAKGPLRVCVAASAEAPGRTPLPAHTVDRQWYREPYEALIQRAAKAPPPGGVSWVLLSCDPSTVIPSQLAGAIEHELGD